jgi:outer membrane protein OmpA-like peptidoglycan-associated protein
LSADGSELYFSSNRPGGLGGYDIWYSNKNEDGWTKAVNAGPSINTSLNEISPYIHVNNKTLFFVSDGYPGFGGYDIYQIEKSGESWSSPENMGKPLNDQNDQFSLMVANTGEVGYYSREESKTKTKLYEIKFPKELVVKSKGNVVKGIVEEENTKKTVAALIELRDIVTSKRISQVISDSVSGEYLMVLPGGSEYALYVSGKGYLFQSLHFNYKETDEPVPVIKNISLAKIRSGASVVLNNIFFDHDKYEIKSESITELREVVNFLNDNQNIKIEISGHTDNTGDEGYNQKLSLLRANAVANYLESNGVSEKRLVVKGFGSRKPLNENVNEEERSLNRRIEFKIL